MATKTDLHGHTRLGEELFLPEQAREREELRQQDTVSRDISDNLRRRIEDIEAMHPHQWDDNAMESRSRWKADYVVLADGTGTHRYIQDAINAAATAPGTRGGATEGRTEVDVDKVIFIGRGTWGETVTIPANAPDLIIVSGGDVVTRVLTSSWPDNNEFVGGAIFSGNWTFSNTATDRSFGVIGCAFTGGAFTVNSSGTTNLAFMRCKLDIGGVIVTVTNGAVMAYLSQCLVRASGSSAFVTAATSGNLHSIAASDCYIARPMLTGSTAGGSISLIHCLLNPSAASIVSGTLDRIVAVGCRIQAGAATPISGTLTSGSVVRLVGNEIEFTGAFTGVDLTTGNNLGVFPTVRITGNMIDGDSTAASNGVRLASGTATTLEGIVQGNLFSDVINGVSITGTALSSGDDFVVGPNAFATVTNNHVNVPGGNDWQTISGGLGGVGTAGSVVWTDGTTPQWTINPLIAGYARIGSASAPGNTTAGDLTSVRLFINNDSNYFLSVVSSNPRMTMDSGDYWQYNRASNQIELVLGTSASPANIRFVVDARNTLGATASIYFYTQETVGTGAYAGPAWFRQGATDTRLKFSFETDTGSGTAQDPDLTLFRFTGAVGAEVRDAVFTVVNSTARIAIYSSYNLSFRASGNYINSSAASRLDLVSPTVQFDASSSVTIADPSLVANRRLLLQSDYSTSASHLQIAPLTGTNRLAITTGTGRADILVGASSATIAIAFEHASGLVNIGGGTIFNATLQDAGSFLAATWAAIGRTTAPTNTTTGDLTCTRFLVGDATLTVGVEAQITGDMTLSGYTRIGSVSAPTNVTAGDLTCIRLLVGDAALGAGVEAAILGDQTTSGFLRVGSATAPTNTTAGDITCGRLAISNTAIPNFEVLFSDPSITDTSATTKAGFTFNATISNGASNVSAEYRTINQLLTTLGSASGNLTNATGVQAARYDFRHRSTGVLTRFVGVMVIAGPDGLTQAASGAITTMDSIEVNYTARTSTTATVTTWRGLLVSNLTLGAGPSVVTTAIGIDIAALSGAGTNFGIRNASNSQQTGYARFGAVTAPVQTTAGDLTAIRLFIGDQTLANSTQAHIVQPTVGNDVLQLISTATNDDPVERVLQGRAATTDATVTTLATIAIPASTTVHIEAHVIARRTGGTLGTADDGAGYILDGTYKTAAGTVTLIGALALPYTAEDQVLWDATLTISGTNVLVSVTGATSNNITWHCTARIWPVGT